MQIKIRIDYFDIAKGISIIAVILGHCKGLPLEIINFVFYLSHAFVFYN